MAGFRPCEVDLFVLIQVDREHEAILTPRCEQTVCGGTDSPSEPPHSPSDRPGGAETRDTSLLLLAPHGFLDPLHGEEQGGLSHEASSTVTTRVVTLFLTIVY